MTVSQPFATVADMWSAFEVLARNKTPAINGQGSKHAEYEERNIRTADKADTKQTHYNDCYNLSKFLGRL